MGWRVAWDRKTSKRSGYEDGMPARASTTSPILLLALAGCTGALPGALPKASPSAKPEGPAGAVHGRYVYLRGGEFFLEDLPAGPLVLTADACGKTGPAQPVVVAADQELPDVLLAGPRPEPVASGSTHPHMVEWAGTRPQALTFHVQDAGTASARTSFDGTDTANVDLVAPAGSGATPIKGVDIVLTWTTATDPTVHQGAHERYPVDVVLAAANGSCPGPATTLQVTLGAIDLAAIFKGPDLPGLVTANLEFIDDQGFAVQGGQYRNLQVEVPLFRR